MLTASSSEKNLTGALPTTHHSSSRYPVVRCYHTAALTRTAEPPTQIMKSNDPAAFLWDQEILFLLPSKVLECYTVSTRSSFGDLRLANYSFANSPWPIGLARSKSIPGSRRCIAYTFPWSRLARQRNYAPVPDTAFEAETFPALSWCSILRMPNNCSPALGSCPWRRSPSLLRHLHLLGGSRRASSHRVAGG